MSYRDVTLILCRKVRVFRSVPHPHPPRWGTADAEIKPHPPPPPPPGSCSGLSKFRIPLSKPVIVGQNIRTPHAVPAQLQGFDLHSLVSAFPAPSNSFSPNVVQSSTRWNVHQYVLKSGFFPCVRNIHFQCQFRPDYDPSRLTGRKTSS